MPRQSISGVQNALLLWRHVAQYIADNRQRKDATAQKRLYSYCTILGVLEHDIYYQPRELVSLLQQHAKANTSWSAWAGVGSNTYSSTLNAIIETISKTQFSPRDLRKAVKLFANEQREKFDTKDDTWTFAARVMARSVNKHKHSIKPTKQERPGAHAHIFEIFQYLQDRMYVGGVEADVDFHRRQRSLYAIFAFVEFSGGDIDQNIAFLREQARLATTWTASAGVGSCRYASLLRSFATALERGDFSFNSYRFSIEPLRDQLAVFNRRQRESIVGSKHTITAKKKVDGVALSTGKPSINKAV